MKAIRLSFFQMAAAMRRDMMLFVSCFTPILAGFFFRFAIPFIETALTDGFHMTAVISPYYKLVDILFAMLPSTMFCFASAMVSLEEKDERTADYLFITRLRKTGYILVRFGVPSVIAFLATILLLPVFKLTALSPLTIFSVVIPFFIKSDLQYIISLLPSFWIGKAILENILLYMLPAFALSAMWIYFLLKRYLRKITVFLPASPIPPYS